MAENWQHVASMSDLEEDEPFRVRVDDTQIALCRLGDEVFAIDNICTHDYAELSDGFIEGDCIECPLHQAQFDIRTGKALTAPAVEDLATYPCRVDGDDVLVDMGS